LIISETYQRVSDVIVRQVSRGAATFVSQVENRAAQGLSPADAWWQSFLKGGRIDIDGPASKPITVVDAFCACGGFTLGAVLAATAFGRKLTPLAAIDVDEGALRVYQHNFPSASILPSNVSSLVDFQVHGYAETARFAYEPEVTLAALKAIVGDVDVFLAGPPCQGHSNLNNRTRREDPRNLLYGSAVALGVALQAKAIVIENVPEVVNDKKGIVETGKSLLAASGYQQLEFGVLRADGLGAPQTRRRFFLIGVRDDARTSGSPGVLNAVKHALHRPATSVSWAIGDLLDNAPHSILDQIPVLSVENVKRIEYLFQHNLFDLPDHERPDCHQAGTTYRAVYGRLQWDKPAPTITTGFLTPGRGRYIHPLRPRVLTPREAARIQMFPDSFQFINGREPSRSDLAKWIGDAVPSVMGQAAVISALSMIFKDG
jgi:DNA (cytosine-5)-methyltransferase 1